MHTYIHNTVKLAGIILSIIGGFSQQCITGQRGSIIHQCLINSQSNSEGYVSDNSRSQSSAALGRPEDGDSYLMHEMAVRWLVHGSISKGVSLYTSVLLEHAHIHRP